MVTLRPLACNSFAREAAMIPFPKEEVTPPVTKIYLAIKWLIKLLLNALFYYQATGKNNNLVSLDPLTDGWILPGVIYYAFL